MRPRRTRVRLQLRLPGQIQAFMRVSRVELVPQIRAQVRVVLLRLPGPAMQLPTDRGAVHSESSGDFSAAVLLLVELLNLYPVFNPQMTVMCTQGSATLSR